MNTSQVNAVAVRVYDASRRGSDLDDGSRLLVVRDGGNGGNVGLVVVRDRRRGSYDMSSRGRLYEIASHAKYVPAKVGFNPELQL